MGFAILWIMAFHHPVIEIQEISYFLESIGYCGVDIFAVCSGLGLFYSMKRNNNNFAFFSKRFVRIIPLTVVYIFLLFSLVNYEGLSFFSIEAIKWVVSCTWYVIFCILTYLLFPLLYKYNGKLRMIAISYTGISVGLVILHPQYFNFWLIWTRFADVLLGVYIAKCINSNSQGNKLYITGLGIVGVILLYIFHHNWDREILYFNGMNYYPAVLFTTLLCFTICKIISFSKITNKLLGFVGQITLELYFAHYIVASMLIHYGYFNALSYYMLSIAAAYLLWHCNNLISSRIKLVLSKVYEQR